MTGCQKKKNERLLITITETINKCPIGEKFAVQNMDNDNIPVLSCEGACIRGEIARLTANYVSKYRNFSRGCLGETITVPGSKMTQWIESSEKVVCIDGCFQKCLSRILENFLAPSTLVVFDAFSFHKKYNDIYKMDEVPESELKEVAKSVAQWMIKSVNKDLNQK